MKLTGRAVLFNYMLELDAVDVSIIKVLVLKAESALVAQVCEIPHDLVADRLSQLNAAIDVAIHQVARTRALFADGGEFERMPGRKPMRGIDVAAFTDGEQPPVPRG